MNDSPARITGRAVALGLLFAALAAILTLYFDNRHSIHVTAVQIPVLPYVLLLLTVLLVNPLLRLLRVFRRLSAVEMLIIFIMTMVSSGMSTYGLAQQFLVVGTHALYAYETAAGVRVQSGAMATRDLDLLFDVTKLRAFTTLLNRAETRSLIAVLQRADKTFKVRRDKLETNTAYWRKGLSEAGFILKEGDTPIVPVMLFNAKLSQDFSRELYQEGIYAIGFFFPVVPQGQARIRTQISAGHERHHLDKALDAFIKAGKKYGILKKTKEEITAMYGM